MKYDIEVIGASEVQQVELISDIIDASPFNPFESECEWKFHETVMRMVSLANPEILFKLIGAGEETEDLWHKYFKGGKMQECRGRVVYDEFDEGELK